MVNVASPPPLLTTSTDTMSPAFTSMVACRHVSPQGTSALYTPLTTMFAASPRASAVPVIGSRYTVARFGPGVPGERLRPTRSLPAAPAMVSSSADGSPALGVAAASSAA